MYSGTTFRRDSGRIVGVHQRIDRAARRSLNKLLLKSMDFPTIKNILHFEGKNGPDGIKLKSPYNDEPRHFIDPENTDDDMLLQIINDHIHNLSTALISDNMVKAAFEAAWLAHSIVDGLTPAHHYPLSDNCKDLQTENENYLLMMENLHLISDVRRKEATLKKLESWGTRGVLVHILFECGVASVVATDSFKKIELTKSDIRNLKKYGFDKMFKDSLQKIFAMNMYNEFSKKGWTRHLAVQTKKILVPEIIKAVTLAWYSAIIFAEESK